MCVFWTAKQPDNNIVPTSVIANRTEAVDLTEYTYESDWEAANSDFPLMFHRLSYYRPTVAFISCISIVYNTRPLWFLVAFSSPLFSLDFHLLFSSHFGPTSSSLVNTEWQLKCQPSSRNPQKPLVQCGYIANNGRPHSRAPHQTTS